MIKANLLAVFALFLVFCGFFGAIFGFAMLFKQILCKFYFRIRKNTLTFASHLLDTKSYSLFDTKNEKN